MIARLLRPASPVINHARHTAKHADKMKKEDMTDAMEFIIYKTVRASLNECMILRRLQGSYRVPSLLKCKRLSEFTCVLHLSHAGHVRYDLTLRDVMNVLEHLSKMNAETGFIHGDLRPENICWNDNTFTLIDFETSSFHSSDRAMRDDVVSFISNCDCCSAKRHQILQNVHTYHDWYKIMLID